MPGSGGDAVTPCTEQGPGGGTVTPCTEHREKAAGGATSVTAVPKHTGAFWIPAVSTPLVYTQQHPYVIYNNHPQPMHVDVAWPVLQSKR